MRYLRVRQSYTINSLDGEECKHGVGDSEKFITESIWVAKKEDHMILLNNVLELLPFPSYGLIVPLGFRDCSKLKTKPISETEWPLHYEIWDALFLEGLIDKDGYYIR